MSQTETQPLLEPKIEPSRVTDLSALTVDLDLADPEDQQAFLRILTTSPQGFGASLADSRSDLVSHNVNSWVYRLRTKVDAKAHSLMSYVKIVDINATREPNPEAHADLVLKFTQEIMNSPVAVYFTDVGATFKQEQAYGFVLEGYHGFDGARRFAGGKERYEKRAQKHMKWKSIEQYLARGLRVLDYMHHHGYVYRDLSPANILLDEYDNAYFSDWGAISTINDPQVTPTDQDTTGTWYFRAPEMVPGSGREGLIRPPTDIYMFASVLYFFISGGKLHFDRPQVDPQTQKRTIADFSEVNIRTAALQNLNRYYPLAQFFEEALVHSSLPPEQQTSLKQKLVKLDTILEKALQSDPQARYQSAAEMASAFQQLLSDGNITDKEYAALWPKDNLMTAVNKLIAKLKGGQSQASN